MTGLTRQNKLIGVERATAATFIEVSFTKSTPMCQTAPRQSDDLFENDEKFIK